MQDFYRRRFELHGRSGGQTGAVTVVQRTSSDLRLNPHYHLPSLDGVFVGADGDEAPTFHQLSQLSGKRRPLVVPAAKPASCAGDLEPEGTKGGSRCGWRPWAELMKRVFKVEVDKCSVCGARMKLRALVTEPSNVRRYLRHLDEVTELPSRASARGPPYFKSRVVRRKLAQQAGQVGLLA